MDDSAELHTPPLNKIGLPDGCSIAGCVRKFEAHGWCSAHYRRWLRHGDPLGGRKSRTPAGQVQAYLEEALAYAGEDCLAWPYAKSKFGYGVIQHQGKKRNAHQIICERANGPRPTPRHHAAHNCGNGSKGCCNPKHLRWATPAENMADRSVHGTQPVGEKNPRARLKREDVIEIRKRMHLQLQPQSRIAKDFGVSLSLVQRIRNRKAWASIPDIEGVSPDAR